MQTALVFLLSTIIRMFSILLSNKEGLWEKHFLPTFIQKRIVQKTSLLLNVFSTFA